MAATLAVCRSAGRLCPVTSGCSWRPRLGLWCAAEGGLRRGQDQCSHGSQTGRYSGGVIIDTVTIDNVTINIFTINSVRAGAGVTESYQHNDCVTGLVNVASVFVVTLSRPPSGELWQ